MLLSACPLCSLLLLPSLPVCLLTSAPRRWLCVGVFSVHVVRARGGNLKFRAMRLDTGNFAWGSETCTRKTRILDVVYNASNNELVRRRPLADSPLRTYSCHALELAACMLVACCMSLTPAYSRSLPLV